MMSMAVARGTGRSDSGRLVGHRATGGLLQEGAFDEAGKQTGLWKRYHSNGRLLDVGEYEAGHKVGEWKHYDADGTLSRTKQQ